MRAPSLAGTCLATLLLTGCTAQPAPTPTSGSPTASAAAPSAVPRSIGVPEGFEARAAARVEKVVDGDTVVLRGGERIRVLGIDTPELRGRSELERRLAADAKAELKRLLGSGRVVPVGRPGHRDQYDRTLAYLHAARDDGSPGEDLGARLLATGYARIYPSEHPQLAPYLQVQEGARSRGRGIWTEAGMAALGLGFEVEIDAVHAGAHVGRRARVVGFIAGTHRSEGAIYLNLGPDWRRDFTAVIVKPQWELFPDDVERRWRGKKVAITGEIAERRGRPEIRLRSPGQVELLEN
jgi:endonuclease YncB( thermonuclease family)